MDDIQSHLPRLLRVALRILGDRSRAEDVVQDVCLRVLNQPESFDGNARFSTWLHRITVNRAIDVLRERRRENRRQVEWNGELAGLLAGDTRLPDETAEINELRRIAQLVIEELPDDCRHSFVLTQLDGYTYDEAAEIECVPRGTVASRVTRAKRILLKHLHRVM